MNLNIFRNISRKSQNGAVTICSKCVDYTVQMKMMQGKMRELQEQIKEQQCEITALHKRNEYLKEFEPDTVQKIEQCSVCELKLTTDTFYLHLCQHMDDKCDIIRCEYCSKSYNSTIKLLNHLNIGHNRDTDKTLYYCKQCPKIFEMAQLMDIHERVHPDKKPEIECEKCSQKIFTQHDYDEHMRTHHSDPEESLTLKRKCILI